MLKVFTAVFLGVLCLITMPTTAQNENYETPISQENPEEIDNKTKEFETLGQIIKIGEPVEVGSNQVVSSIISIGGDVKVNGRVDRDIFVFVGDIEIGPDAKIGKDVTTIVGHIKNDRNQINGHCREINKNPFAMMDLIMSGLPKTTLWTSVMFIATLLVHIFLTVLLSENIGNMALAINRRFIGVSMLGLLTLIIAPLISILLVLSIAGIPLLIVFYSFLFITTIYGKTALFVSIGNAVIKKTRPNIIAVSLGYIIYFIATYVPYIGKITFIVAIILGIGASLRTLFGIKRGIGRHPRHRATLIR